MPPISSMRIMKMLSATPHRKVSETIKKRVAGRQRYKCANKPDMIISGLEGYKCLLWQPSESIYQGSFDEAGYEIDHIKEFSLTYDNAESNLQALCVACHNVKTRRFLSLNPKSSLTRKFIIRCRDDEKINIYKKRSLLSGLVSTLSNGSIFESFGYERSWYSVVSNFGITGFIKENKNYPKIFEIKPVELTKSDEVMKKDEVKKEVIKPEDELIKMETSIRQEESNLIKLLDDQVHELTASVSSLQISQDDYDSL